MSLYSSWNPASLTSHISSSQSYQNHSRFSSCLPLTRLHFLLFSHTSDLSTILSSSCLHTHVNCSITWSIHLSGSTFSGQEFIVPILKHSFEGIYPVLKAKIVSVSIYTDTHPLPPQWFAHLWAECNSTRVLLCWLSVFSLITPHRASSDNNSWLCN